MGGELDEIVNVLTGLVAGKEGQAQRCTRYLFKIGKVRL